VDVVTDLILQAAASPWLLPVMFAAAVIDGFFPPMPSETVLVAAAAVAAATGDAPTLVALSLVAALGAAIGDNVAYAIGRRVGTTRDGWMRRPRVAAALERARAALTTRGAPLILGARYIPVGRVAVNMSAGALGYPWRRFVPLSVVGGISWALYSVLIGTLAGQWLGHQPVLSAVIGVVLALGVGVVIDRVVALRRRRGRVVEVLEPDPASATLRA
jgi:membrane protein DedA with SNARE-associated domain